MSRSTSPLSILSRSGRVIGLSLGVVALVTACEPAPAGHAAETPEAPASAVSAAKSDEAVLLERADGYWDARRQRLRKVLKYYAPPGKGGPTSLAEVSEAGNLRYLAHEVREAKIDGDTAIVKVWVKLDAQIRNATFRVPEALRESVVRERWIKVDGVWYKKPVPRGLSKHARKQARNDDLPVSESHE